MLIVSRSTACLRIYRRGKRIGILDLAPLDLPFRLAALLIRLALRGPLFWRGNVVPAFRWFVGRLAALPVFLHGLLLLLTLLQRLGISPFPALALT
jgi:hypothetical protein